VSVFIIINEWSTVDGDSFSEVVDCRYFEDLEAARDALVIIAEGFGVETYDDEYNFSMSEPTNHIVFQEYYVQELGRNGQA